MEPTSAQKLARSLLENYGHEVEFEVKLIDKAQADAVHAALLELDCHVRQDGLTLVVTCPER
jgi:hypothetical protein